MGKECLVWRTLDQAMKTKFLLMQCHCFLIATVFFSFRLEHIYGIRVGPAEFLLRYDETNIFKCGFSYFK